MRISWFMPLIWVSEYKLRDHERNSQIIHEKIMIIATHLSLRKVYWEIMREILRFYMRISWFFSLIWVSWKYAERSWDKFSDTFWDSHWETEYSVRISRNIMRDHDLSKILIWEIFVRVVLLQISFKGDVHL